MKSLSIVVPTLNEAKNIAPLVSRIATTLNNTGITYEVLFIDDKSKDHTLHEIDLLKADYPVSAETKIGKRGKAFSLLQGFKKAKYDVICMIDADLQYPPEAILPMYKLLSDNDVDVILTERTEQKTSALRKLSSNVFNFIFTRMLFGFDYDSQSGLKLFRKHVISNVTLSPTPWSFDLEFIVRALENNFKILTFKIPFGERLSGETKVRVLKLTYELSKASLKLRASSSSKHIKASYQNNVELGKKVGITGMAVLLLTVFNNLLVGETSKALISPLLNETTTSLNNSIVKPLLGIPVPTTGNNQLPQPSMPTTPSATSNSSPAQPAATTSTQSWSTNPVAADPINTNSAASSNEVSSRQTPNEQSSVKLANADLSTMATFPTTGFMAAPKIKAYNSKDSYDPSFTIILSAIGAAAVASSSYFILQRYRASKS